MYSRILVPLDGSALAAQALPYAQAVAQATGASVGLIEVINLVALLMSQAAPGEEGATPRAVSPERLAALSKSRLDQAERRIERAAAPLRQAGLTVKVTAVVDDPAEGIARAGGDASTLIVMCTHGRSGFARLTLGSVTNKVLMRATSPVLVVRGAARRRPAAIKRVVLALEGSSFGEAAIPQAVEMAKAFGAGMMLVHAVQPVSAAALSTDDVTGATFQQLQEAVVHDTAQGKAYVSDVAGRIRRMGVESVAERVVVQSPADAILSTVGGDAATLTAMATHARSGVGRWVLGSVTDAIIRRSPGPVLVVRPGS